MALTEAEKAKCRYHLGYLATTNEAAALTYGMPTTIQPMFLIERALNLLPPQGEIIVRNLLKILDDTEAHMLAAQCQLGADKVGNITLAGGGGSGGMFGKSGGGGALATDRFEAEVGRWAQRLADTLGVPVYPFSSRFSGMKGAGSIPVRNS